MNNFIPKKTLILILILLIIVTATILISRLSVSPTNNATTPSPVITQSASPSYSSQKSIIGRTTIEDFEKTNKFESKQNLANNRVGYSINSNINARPNQVIFQDNKAAFERIIVISDNIKISDQTIRHGVAERVIKGSKFYGHSMDTYIYANKGLAFIANTNTDEVYEIQIFPPTSVDSYLNSYGEDINENKGVKE